MIPLNDSLLRRLPLPLAQLYRRAHNAKSPRDAHDCAMYLWEASIKLLGAAALATLDAEKLGTPEIENRLPSLARPTLGHWREFIRLCVPLLVQDDRYAKLARALDERRADLPRCAALESLLRDAMNLGGGVRQTVRVTDLLDRIVEYRNKGIAHAAPAVHGAETFRPLADRLLAAAAEFLPRDDVLAGRLLVAVTEVRPVRGVWLVERAELRGAVPWRMTSLELTRDDGQAPPLRDGLYLSDAERPDDPSAYVPLHPLLDYDSESETVRFLNGRRGKNIEFLCYCTGRRILLPADASRLAPLDESNAERDDRGVAAAGHGRVFGDYELISELGRGAMGVVYRARQTVLGREVAIKVQPRPGDAKADARFRREVRALARVDHPNLVKVHTSGVEGDLFYYTMELLPGAPLSDVNDALTRGCTTETRIDLTDWQSALNAACANQHERPLSEHIRTHSDLATSPGTVSEESPGPAERVIATTDGSVANFWALPGRDYIRGIVMLMRPICEAADSLHQAGVLHRDIKPGNILVSPDGTQAVLLDLGLAQLADDLEGRLTRTRQFVGTLRYASPQQVLAAATLDRRSDVYSLGATLWELLALRPIFEATDDTPTPQLMERIQRDEPERLNHVVPFVGRDLEAIVHKCLEKDPDRRYATAHELAEDLGRWLDGEPVRARKVGRLDRAAKWVRRRPIAAGFAAVSVLLILATTAMLISQIGKARLAEALAETERERQRADSNRQLAEREQREASHQRDLSHRYLYASRTHLAQQAWNDSQITRMNVLLKEQDRDFGGPASERLRGFEWNYLRRLPGQWLMSIKAHEAEIHRVIYSPDGRRVVSIGIGGGQASCWNTSSGRKEYSLTGEGRIDFVAFSPNGSLVAAIGAGQYKVELYDANDGRLIRVFEGPRKRVLKVAFDAVGQRLAMLGIDSDDRGALAVIDVHTGERLSSVEVQSDGMGASVFSADGAAVAAADRRSYIHVWEVPSGKLLRTLRGHRLGITALAFSPNGKEVASSSRDSTIRVWEIETGDAVVVAHGHRQDVLSVAFSPDGNRLVSAGKDATVRTWNARTGASELVFRGHEGNTYCAVFSPDGHKIVSSSYDTTLKFWNSRQPQEYRVLSGHRGGVGAVAFSPDGNWLASAGLDKTVRIWDMATRKEKKSLLGHTSPVRCVDFSSDGARVVASGEADITVRIWDVLTGQMVRELKGHSGDVTRVVFSPDGGRVASAGAGSENKIRIWDSNTGEQLAVCEGHRHWLQGVAWTPDEKHVVSASSDSTVRIWDATNGKELRSLIGHESQVVCVAVHPSGQYVVSGGTDRIIHVWDFATGVERHKLHGSGRDIQFLAFTPDGRRLAAGDYDGHIKIWDATLAPAGPEEDWKLLTGQEVLTLLSPTRVRTLAFGRNGTILASCSENSPSIRIWDATPIDEKE